MPESAKGRLSLTLPCTTRDISSKPQLLPGRLVPLHENGIAFLGDAGECEGSTELDLAQHHQGLVDVPQLLPDRLVPLHKNGIALLRDAGECEGSAQLDLAQHHQGLVLLNPALT